MSSENPMETASSMYPTNEPNYQSNDSGCPPPPQRISPPNGIPDDVEMRQDGRPVEHINTDQHDVPSAEAAAALPPTAYISAPEQPPQSTPAAPEPPPTPEPPHAQLPSALPADINAQPSYPQQPAYPSSFTAPGSITNPPWGAPAPAQLPLKPDPTIPAVAPTVPPAAPAYSTETPPAPPPANYHPNTHGSPTRVYINQNVTPHLLEGMKYLAVYEPEKPLRWLSDFLAKRSREVEG